jgi:hypothetical protein
MHLNNINGMNKKETLLRKDTRTPMCARRCVRACACARRCVRVRVCVGEGITFAFLFARVGARGCVRVCVCACGWGGVQCRRSFGARARRLVSTYTPGTQRDKLFTFTTTPRLFTTPLYHTPKLFTTPQVFFTSPKAVWHTWGLFAFLWVTFSLGYLIGFSWGGGVVGGGCFWVGVLFGAVG